VGLGPATVVRLERALAHEVLPLHDRRCAPPVGGRAGCRQMQRAPHPGLPKLVPRTSLPQPRRTQRGHGSRIRPRTRDSIAEECQSPAAGRIPTTHDDRRVPIVGDGTPPPTRPDGGARRCRAVDGAVSVAVAPHRTTGSRSAGRPHGHPTPVAPVTPENGALTSRDAGQAPGRGRLRWHPHQSCTACGHSCGTSDRANPPGNPRGSRAVFAQAG
jgi:hypothetical protein